MLKCTLFFQVGIQGWSETWFLDGNSLGTAQTAIGALGAARLAMCPASVQISATRISIVDQPAVFRVAGRIGNGTYTTTRDITNMAVFWTAVADDYTRRTVLTRGTPDDCVVSGLYQPTPAFAAAAVGWASTLSSQGFSIRAIDRAQPIYNIASVGATGIMTMFDANILVANDVVKFFRSHTDSGKSILKKYRVGAKLTATTYQLLAWPDGLIATNVKARKIGYVLSRPTTIYPRFASSRKTGRPFGLRAGRRKVTVA